MRAAQNTVGPEATSKRLGIPVKNFSIAKFLLHSDDAMQRTGHPDIRQVGRAPGKNLFVGGLHMRMSADHGRRLAIKIMTHRHFFRRGLGMHIHEHRGDPLPQPPHFPLGDLEGTIQGRHVRAPHQL